MQNCNGTVRFRRSADVPIVWAHVCFKAKNGHDVYVPPGGERSPGRRSLRRQLSSRQNIFEPNRDEPKNHANDTKNHRYERITGRDGQNDRLREYNDRKNPANPVEDGSQDVSQEFSQSGEHRAALS